MSDLKVRSGQPLTATRWNEVVDRLPPDITTSGPGAFVRLVLCRTTETIGASTINESDTTASVYESGTVDAHGLINNGDGTFSPGKLPGNRIMINASAEEIPSGTELWAIDTYDGILVSTVWIC